ncbi:MAG TPA: cytochrome C oxidase subunit IV family protein [Rariglobus sp.]|jgi:cytochrome c oxidase subunit 4|nr:cytochrome C oxidase subunit IV family protein [Rariglobus sp.]
MSASSPALAASGHDAPQESKFHLLVQMAMVLAILTGMEVVTVYLPLPKWLIIAGLMVLLTVKFVLGIWLFMHLKWDKLFCTILFLIGLILAGGTAAALLVMFNDHDSVPLTSKDLSAVTIERTVQAA